MDARLFKKIPSYEFLHQRWSRHVNTAQHVREFIAHYNAVCSWAANQIVKDSNVGKRAQVIKQLVKVAEVRSAMCLTVSI